MEGGRGEANGEYVNAGCQCGQWGSFTLLGSSKEPEWIHQNSPSEEGEEGEAAGFIYWIQILISEVFSSLP